MPSLSALPRSRSLAVLALVATVAFLACASDEPSSSTISADELAERISDGQAPLILDVRSEEEFESGHIPGARNVPHNTLAEHLGDLGVGTDEEIVVHCQGGRRASLAEQVLRDAGYTNVRDLEGQFQGWQDAGLPTE